MKRNTHKLLSVIVALIMALTAFSSQGVFAATTEGKTFNASQVYQLNKTIPTTLPQTYEAWVKLPKSTTSRGGVVLGNYKDANTACLSIEIHENGVPRIYCVNGSTKIDQKFTSADVRSDGWAHLAITWSGTTATCYINGENKGSVTASMPTSLTMSNPLCVGGDLRSKNEQYFKGSIKQVAVYKDVRTQAEIQADMTALDTTDSEMLMAFNLQGSALEYADLTQNGYVVATIDTTAQLDPTKWFSEDDIYIPEDYDFSFMAIGDTQIVTRYDATGLTRIYDYVIGNVKSKKVKHVMGLGDITDADTDWEWERATAQIARMDGVVPYSIVRGNHDIYSTKVNGSPSMKRVSTYDTIYGTEDSPYAKQYTYCYEYPNEGEELFRARNTVHFFSSDTRDYMVVALDYGASDDVLNWAGKIIAAHPYHNVIVTTHNYLNTDGTTADKGESTVPSRDYNSSNSYGVNDGGDMWNELISQHSNIVLVLSGHKPCDNLVMTQRQGVNGNTVTEFLIDPQGMDVDDSKGMVATFYVDENGEDITVEWYSTIKNAYYKKTNNYSFKVNVIERMTPKTVSFDANGGSGTMEEVTTQVYNYPVPECSFKAPSNKYTFIGWSLTPNGDVIDTETITMDSNITLYAIWERMVLPSYNVTVANGTVSPTSVFEVGDLVTITAKEPAAGKRFTGWYGLSGITIVEGNSSTMTVTFEMPNKAVSVSAMYEDILFKINASAGANGKISKTGNVSVKQGASYTFTFTPNKGYKVKDVLVNGVSVGAVDSYTFENITQNATISVSFEEIATDPDPVDPPTTPSGGDSESSGGCGSSADAGGTTLLVTLSFAVLMVLKRIKG